MATIKSYSIKNILLFTLIAMFSLSLQAQDNAPLPDFELTNTKGQKVSPNTLDKDKPIVVFYFDPDCDHCLQQASWVKEAINKFKGVTMIWISWGEPDAISAFESKYFGGLNEHNRIYFCKDEDYKMDDWFGYSEVPSIYIYNKSRVRIATFKKETLAEHILAKLKE